MLISVGDLLKKASKQVSTLATIKSEKIKKKILEWLALLGGLSGKTASDDEEPDPRIDPAELKRELQTKMQRSHLWDKAFNESILPHIHDHWEYKKGVFPKLVFSNLKEKVGLLNAVNFFEEAMSHIIDNLEHYIRLVHAGPGTKGISREPHATMFEPRKSDPNYKELNRNREDPFTIEIISENPAKPFNYTVSVEGRGLTKANYELDASDSMLEMLPGQKYLAEVRSVVSGGKKLYIVIPDAKKGEDFLMIMSKQVPQVIMKGVDDFINTEFKNLLTHAERAEIEKKKVLDDIEKLKKELEETDDPEKVKDISEKIREKERRFQQLEEMGFEGTKTEEGKKVEPMFETPITRLHEKKAPHTVWYEVKYDPGIELKKIPYRTPGIWEEIATPNEDDFAKFERELYESVSGEIHGIPMKDLVRMMYEAIKAVPKPDKRNWKGGFIERLEDYARKYNVKLPSERKNLYAWGDEVVREVQDKILHDERFIRLKDNLARALMRQFSASDQSIADKIEQAWRAPEVSTLRTLYNDILLEHGKIPSRIIKEIDRVKDSMGPETPVGLNDIDEAIFNLQKRITDLGIKKRKLSEMAKLIEEAKDVVPQMKKVIEYIERNPSDEKQIIDYLTGKTGVPDIPEEYKKALEGIYKVHKEPIETLKKSPERKFFEPAEDQKFIEKLNSMVNYYESLSKKEITDLDKLNQELNELQLNIDRLHAIKQYLKTEPEKAPAIQRELSDEKFDFKTNVYRPTEAGFKRLLGTGNLKRALEILKMLSITFEITNHSIHREFIDRLKFLFLLEVHGLDEDNPNELKLKAELFKDYRDFFTDRPPKISEILNRIKADLAKKMYEDPFKMKELGEKLRRTERVKIEKPESEKVLMERDPELRKELEEILTGF